MIFIECKPDMALIRRVVSVRKGKIIHGFQGRGEICNQLRKRTHCLAIVDQDPDSTRPIFMDEAILIQPEKPTSAALGIRVLFHRLTANHIIMLCANLEDWILTVALRDKVDVRKYGLPNDWRTLHGQINARLDRFEALLHALRDSSPEMRYLRELTENYR